jgi:hypothetical protein
MNNPQRPPVQPAAPDSKSKLRAAIRAVAEAQLALAEEGFVEAERATMDARTYLNEALTRRCRA